MHPCVNAFRAPNAPLRFAADYKILVVDREAGVVGDIRHHLLPQIQQQNVGDTFQLLSAATYTEARDLYEKEHPQLAIIGDLRAANKTATRARRLQLLQHLKTETKPPAVLVYSRLCTEEDVSQCRQAQADSVLPKPFNPAVMLPTMTKMLGLS